ncbi:uncharacterized protein LOC112345591 [Selaginella moellendorffii]|uniref:uncharacterized protein LOC112345591 n=1 Tax=Selaginella moellendorffii TaxID=88036 RepID=UPI000D1CFACA|nr:uncharacterized protein LOC112345591 [Selaginella moellendorffii]|eukprot:XP_024528481.1 uncharacterized protein LOC112345591 [Selaginella moellendorffii]
MLSVARSFFTGKDRFLDAKKKVVFVGSLPFTRQRVPGVMCCSTKEDFETMRQKLPSMDLGGLERPLGDLADVIHNLGAWADASEALQSELKLKANYSRFTGGPLFFLVYDCIRMVAESLTTIYRDSCESELDARTRSVLAKALRQYRKGRRRRIVRLENRDPTAWANFQMFAACLCLSLENRLGLAEAEVEILANVVVPFHRAVVTRYAQGFGEEARGVIMEALAPDNGAELGLALREWVTYCNVCGYGWHKDTPGPHPAVWSRYTTDPTREYARLLNAQAMLSKLIEKKNPHAAKLPRTSKVAVLHYGEYVEQHRPAGVTSPPELPPPIRLDPFVYF